MTAVRLSPLHDCVSRLQPVWGQLNGMLVPLRYAPATSSSLELCDLSALNRAGLKGPAASDWLQGKAIPVPLRPNSWMPMDGGGVVARLGRGEFFIEDGAGGTAAATLRAELGAGTTGLYPVLRQDAALRLRGPAVHELFAQTCNIDFKSIPSAERVATLTMMIGVAVTVINTSLDDSNCYRIWCDGTYGAYLWDTLLEIATELGGHAVGLEAIYPNATDSQPVDA
jgi:sarcosine oxidase subunit gamma